MLGAIFERFEKLSPISVMVRGLIERVFAPETIDCIFEENASSQYTRELLFSSLVELMSKRGLSVDYTTVFRWVQAYAAKLEKRTLLSAKRDKRAVKGFFHKALNSSQSRSPRVINVDKNAAYSLAIGELKVEENQIRFCQLRQNKYLRKIFDIHNHSRVIIASKRYVNS